MNSVVRSDPVVLPKSIFENAAYPLFALVKSASISAVCVSPLVGFYSRADPALVLSARRPEMPR